MPDVRARVAFVLVMAAGSAIPVTAPAQPVAAQDVANTEAIAQWIALPAPPGAERAATDIISGSVQGWTRDRLGNLILRRGSGSPRRVIACGLDEAAYVVSEVTPDGYVRLQSSGRARRSPLWDQFHEGQRIRIITRTGARPAVVAVRSTHLWRARPSSEPIVRVDDLWVDVGARTRAEVAQLGIALLNPVIREWPPWRYADMVAGPAAGDRAGCGAVAAAAALAPGQGETVWVISVQHAFTYVGLQAALARDTGAPATEPVTRRTITGPVARPFAGRADAVVAIGIRSLHPGTLVETVRGSDVTALAEDVARASGIAHAPEPAIAALRGVGGAPPPAIGTDSMAGVARLMATLSDAYGVSGHEGPVREAVRAAIPAAWRGQPTHVDLAGNLIISAGPDRDTVVFVAHMDEIGYQITRIAHDGSVTLSQVGGFYSSLWEGQPALVHLSDEGRQLAESATCPLAAAAASERAVVPA